MTRTVVLTPSAEDGLDGMEICQLLHGRYRILFTIETDQVTILQIRHGARLPMR